MLRSKAISDYVEAKLSEFRPNVDIPVDLHLYFARNRHILVWRKHGEPLTDDLLEKYRGRGVESVWIHRDDLSAWSRYLRGSDDQAPAPLPELKTEEGRAIQELMRDEKLDDRSRVALVAMAARTVLAIQPLEQARDTVRDILEMALESATQQAREVAYEVWDLARAGGEGMDHSLNVATYAVLFAMAFGRIDESLLADIGLAGLLHDIGISQIPSTVAVLPVQQHQAADRKVYAAHVDESVALISSYAGAIPPRVKSLISQHHEKFDGSGYPQGLKGFKVDDVAQLLAMADTLESLCSGRWDGKRRSQAEALRTLQSLEKQKAFPEYFNPDVFSAVLRWMSDDRARTAAVTAAEVVRAKARQVVGRVQRAS